MEKKIKVGILGATGMVGQRFISLLAEHPWYEITALAASPRSAGRTYEECIEGKWKLDEKMPASVKNIVIDNVNEVSKIADKVDFIFSAVDMKKDEIKAIEDEYAKSEIPVVSNNSAHRWTKDVPMVIPEVNPEHFDIIASQKKRLNTKKGFVAVKPNCSIQSYAPLLKAWECYKPTRVIATTYQAISGAGKTFLDWPEMKGNIIPYIAGEEEKSELEPLKILGKIEGDEIVNAASPLISTQCIRVPVLNGHTCACFIDFENKPESIEDLIRLIENYEGEPQKRKLPSAPTQFIQYLREDNRPQISEDVNFQKGMGVSIGRLREDVMFDYKFVGLSHNTLRGAAGGAVLCAELLTSLGYIGE